MPAAFIILAGVLAYSYYNQARAAVDNFQYAPVKVIKWHPGILTFGIDFIFKITNNTNTSATITGVDGNLFNGATFLGTFKTFGGFTIPAGGSVEVKANITADNFTAAKLIYNMWLNKQTPAIDFKGAINTQLFGRVPFNYPAALSTDLKFLKRKTAK